MLPFAGARVTKTKLPCVQHLARKIFRKCRRVDFVTQHGIPKMMQMHANLMCAATVQCAFNQAGLLARTKTAIFGLRSYDAPPEISLRRGAFTVGAASDDAGEVAHAWLNDIETPSRSLSGLPTPPPAYQMPGEK